MVYTNIFTNSGRSNTYIALPVDPPRAKEISLVRTFLEFIPIIVYAAIVALIVIVVLILSALLRPHPPQSETKRAAYECGEEPIGIARINFPYSYYMYAIIFAVVDVLAALLFMFALSDLRFELATVLQAFLLVGILMVGLIYGISKVSEVMPTGAEVRKIWEASKKT